MNTFIRNPIWFYAFIITVLMYITGFKIEIYREYYDDTIDNQMYDFENIL